MESPSRVVDVVSHSPQDVESLGDMGNTEVPARLTLDRLRDARLRVVEPIEVIPMVEGGKYVAEAPEINEFGFGDNLAGAVADLQAAVVELYFTLEAEQRRLGSDLAAVWSTLSRKVHKADAASRPRV